MYAILLVHGRNFKFDEIANSTTNNTVTYVEVKKEARGNVATIQSTLNSRYNTSIAVDNIYGKETKKALVKALQTELNKQYNKNLDNKNLAVDRNFWKSNKKCLCNIKKRF
nr:MAG TPA: hypothetical protein [Caudoviricetes sp.]